LQFPTFAGVSEPRVNIEGFPLPNPRVLSVHVHRDEGPHDHAVSLMFAAWGQLTDHDLTFTAETKGRPSTLTWGGANYNTKILNNKPTSLLSHRACCYIYFIQNQLTHSFLTHTYIHI
jgi:hypothetical protein